MSLSAWEQQALDSIKDGLAGSDPELATLLSAFTRLVSGERIPDGQPFRAGSRRALRRLRRARWRSSLRRAGQRLGVQRAALLLWLLATGVVIAVVLVLNAGGGHGSCTETAAMVCVNPAAEHSPGHSSSNPQGTSSPVWQAGP
jgi:Protein of unknown function (DUF3040)